MTPLYIQWQKVIEKINERLKMNKLKSNENKTKIMKINMNSDEVFKINFCKRKS